MKYEHSDLIFNEATTCSSQSSMRINEQILSSLTVKTIKKCAEKTDANNLYKMACNVRSTNLNHFLAGSVSDMFLASVKKGKLKLSKKVLKAINIHQRKAIH